MEYGFFPLLCYTKSKVHLQMIFHKVVVHSQNQMRQGPISSIGCVGVQLQCTNESFPPVDHIRVRNRILLPSITLEYWSNSSSSPHQSHWCMQSNSATATTPTPHLLVLEQLILFIHGLCRNAPLSGVLSVPHDSPHCQFLILFG